MELKLYINSNNNDEYIDYIQNIVMKIIKIMKIVKLPTKLILNSWEWSNSLRIRVLYL